MKIRAMGCIVESMVYAYFRKNQFVIFRHVKLVSALHLPSAIGVVSTFERPERPS
jgi:hypothetical protein